MQWHGWPYLCTPHCQHHETILRSRGRLSVKSQQGVLHILGHTRVCTAVRTSNLTWYTRRAWRRESLPHLILDRKWLIKKGSKKKKKTLFNRSCSTLHFQHTIHIAYAWFHTLWIFYAALHMHTVNKKTNAHPAQNRNFQLCKKFDIKCVN